MMRLRPLAGRSFRTRLTVTITGVFVAAGFALLVAVYLLVSGLMGKAISTSGMAIAEAAGPASSFQVEDVPGVDPGNTTDLVMMRSQSGTTETTRLDSGVASSWFVAQSRVVAGDVRTELLIWSGVALFLFAAVAATTAAWLARRAMRRIDEVTAVADELSTSDLHRRLDLPGPQDEIKKLADTFDGMLDRLERSFASQERFVANASHELRTPLTTARTALEIPMAQGRVPAELQPAILTALRAGRRSEDLITALLTLARGATDGERSPVDLADVVPAAVAARADRIAAAGLQVSVRITSAAVNADPVMLGQAIDNLLDNAVQYNIPAGSIAIDVCVTSSESVLTVENTGRELEPEIVEVLTEPFYRAESSRTAPSAAATDSSGIGGEIRREVRGGIGLGLSIVRSICQSHSGRLELTSRPGGGLVAVLVLPRLGAATHPATTESATVTMAG